MNLCGNHDVLVWDIEDHGGYHTMHMSIAGFFALKPLLKKTGTRAAVIGKYGMPFFVSKMLGRKLFVAGLAGCILFWCLASRFIWDIRIEGNFALTEDVLMDYLEEQGIHTAMKKSALEIAELEQALREDYNLITWTSVQLRGTTLLIHIKENEMPVYDNRNKADSDKGMDLVEEKEGVVTYIITRSGVPQVACGDTVQKGDVLVSGAVPVYNEDTTVRRYQYVQADADITLSYARNLSLEEEIAYDEKCYTGESIEIPVVGTGEKEVAFRIRKVPYDFYDTSEEKKQVQLLDHLYLPVYYGKRTVQEYEIVPKMHTEEEMKTLLQGRWRKIIATLNEKGVQIAEKNVTIKKNEKKWVLHAHMQLEESAVKLTPTITPPVEENEEENTQTD